MKEILVGKEAKNPRLEFFSKRQELCCHMHFISVWFTVEGVIFRFARCLSTVPDPSLKRVAVKWAKGSVWGSCT